MMTIAFSPLLPWPLLAFAALLVLPVAVWSLYRRLRGSALRALAFAALLLALANPILLQEERETLSTVVPVIVDRSQSQQIAGRRAETDAALEQLRQRLAQDGRIEPRFVEVADDGASERPSTRLFAALSDSVADVPPGRIGAAILITDGRVHDLPENGRAPGFDAPLHALVTGSETEYDRRIEIVRAPRFALVGEEQRLTLRIIDDGRTDSAPAEVSVSRNGEPAGSFSAVPGAEIAFPFTLDRAGTNVLEFSVAERAGELTAVNNRAVQLVDGIRQNLRVLLVSGEPHAGERVWRNLLKSDASVDLVHFTILRPPEKQDGTPITELSLIAFPTRELFVDRIEDFDLIIFDRYTHRGVLPILYYDYIARYVENGGALLVAAGPEHAGENSIAITPLEQILPATPTGTVHKAGFYPHLSETGRKHPVTRGLEGASASPPGWGRWFRSVEVAPPAGQTVMQADGERPLLVLDRRGDGRVAMLLSDHGWLWARGFEGGGPHAALYRRIAHWLMKEPELEEEALTARAFGRRLEISRQTIGTDPGPATVTLPSGRVESLPLAEAGPGLYRLERLMQETGLFRIENGGLSAIAHVGAVDAPEFRAMVSTLEGLKPLADASRGLATRIAGDDATVSVPAILPVRGAIRFSDADRMIVRVSDETALRGVTSLPLMAGFAGLAALLLALSAMWWREGR